MSPFGFYPTRYTSGLWTHSTRHISFTLVVDDFGIQYTQVEDVHYLLNTLRKFYTITVDWTGQCYCGFHLQWYYVRRTVDIAMPSYVMNALTKFQHPIPKRKQLAP